MRAQLQRRASPRLHMTALVAATGGAGLLASYAMLHAGLTSMAVRYPLAVAIAYGVFLALVGLWLRRFRLRRRHRDDAGLLDLDVVEVPVRELLRAAPSDDAFPGFGGGGGFAGAGSGRSWADAAPRSVGAVAPRGAGDVRGGGRSGGGWDLDLDDGALWLILLALLAILAFSVAAYLVYVAPVLLAELLLDAGLATGLYGRLARDGSLGESRTWIGTAVRNTIVPACLAAVVLALGGLLLQELAPGTASIGPAAARLLSDAPRS